MQAVDLAVLAVGILRERVPLAHEDLEILVHVCLELANALGREGVRDGLALTCMLDAVSSIEEATMDTDEDIVVFTV